MYTKRSRHITRAQAAHRRSSVSHLLVMMLVMALCITCAVPSIGGTEAYAASLSAGASLPDASFLAAGASLPDGLEFVPGTLSGAIPGGAPRVRIPEYRWFVSDDIISSLI